VIIPTKPTSKARPQVRNRREEQKIDGSRNIRRSLRSLRSVGMTEEQGPLAQHSCAADEAGRIDESSLSESRKAEDAWPRATARGGRTASVAAVADRGGRTVRHGDGHGDGDGLH
jgi:hypothetical protein